MSFGAEYLDCKVDIRDKYVFFFSYIMLQSCMPILCLKKCEKNVKIVFNMDKIWRTNCTQK